MQGSLLILLVLALVVVSGRARGLETCFPPAGFIRSIQGQVDLKRAGGEWRPAALDDPLCAGDLIRVGERSRAETIFANMVQRLDQNTTLSLTRAAKDGRSLLDLREGVAYLFARRPRALDMQTPAVNAAVEGTEFLVQVEPGRTTITVFQGTVVAHNDQGELTLAGGQTLVAEAGAPPRSEIVIRPRDAVAWALYYPFILPVLADRSGAAAEALPEPLGGAVGLAARGDIAAAFARFEAIPEAERGVEFYLYRAAVLLSVGRVDDARADIDQALIRDPDASLAYALRAVIAIARNEREAGLDDARRAVALAPRSAAAKIALSYAEQAQFRIPEARAVLEEAVEDEPDNALAWARLAEVWLMLGHRSRAREAAERAEELAPELERVQTVRGFAALAAIDTRRAKAAFERAIGIDSASPLPRFGLGLAKIRVSDLEEGREDIELAVGLDPDDSLLRSYLGKAFFEEKREALAGEQYAIAKELDPLDPTPWFYDAILKQTENRPVEALRDLEHSIELNDNRAPYRSRQLLDKDRAARQASLARIYNTLGFEQLGINEATRSLALDPGNAAAHRFLSDTYATMQGREIARASELLQAQLLQDININPVQPSLAETDLNIITRGGPTAAGFNEYNTLFERNQAQFNLSGLIGNDWTRGNEVVINGLYDRYSVSAGQFHYQSNGFRQNFDLQHDLYTLFAQAAITPELSVQAEFRHRRTEEGDIELNFDPQRFDRIRKRDFDQDIGRLGFRYLLSPSSTFISSLVFSDRGDKEVRTNPSARVAELPHAKQNGIQGESRYIFLGDFFNMTAGLSLSDENTSLRVSVPIARLSGRSSYRTKQESGYFYANIEGPDDVIWTFGLSADNYEQGDLQLNKINPKAGVQWEIVDNVQLRAATFRMLKPAVFANQTIQPTQVAGFNQLYDDANGTESWFHGVGLDAGLTRNIRTGIDFSRRDLSEPVPVFGRDLTIVGTVREHRTEDIVHGYIYWTPAAEWAVSGEVKFDRYYKEKGPPTNSPRRADTISVPLSVGFFHPNGAFAGVSATFVSQDVDRQPGSVLAEGEDKFFVFNAMIGYRLPHRLGLVSLEASNMVGKKFKFQDESYRWFEDASFISPYLPEHTVIGRVSLNF